MFFNEKKVIRNEKWKINIEMSQKWAFFEYLYNLSKNFLNY